MIKKSLLLSFLMLQFLLSVYAQVKVHKANDDSVRLELLEVQSQNIQNMEAIRNADSLEKASLERQLKEIKSGEQVKYRKLQKEIEQSRISDSLAISNQRRKIDSLRQFVKGFPVVPFKNDTLYFIYSKIGSYSPKDRALSQDQRIQELAEDWLFNPDSLVIQPSETTTDILYKDRIIIGITVNDALWEQTDRNDLAKRYRSKISQAVVNYQKETNWKTILEKAGIALLVIAILVTLLFLINRFFRWTRRKIESQANVKIKGVRIKGYELFDTARERKVFILINRVVKWIMMLVVIYFTLPVLFGLFPWTQHLSEQLLGFILTPMWAIVRSVIDYLPNLFTIVVIVLVFRFVLKGIRFFKVEIEKGSLRIPGFHIDLANPTFQIIRVLVLAFMFIVIFPYLPGSESPVFRGVSVFLGVLFTFGSSGSLSNLIAGLVLTYMRSFKMGDRIRIGSDSGDIIEKGMLVTRIRTPKNEVISIPNSVALNANLVNFSTDAEERGLILHTTVSIGYDTEWRQVDELLLKAAGITELIEKTPAPFVLKTSLDDFYVTYQLNAYTKHSALQAKIYSELHQNILDRFNEAGVQIMSPHYEKDKDDIVIPDKYRKKDQK